MNDLPLDLLDKILFKLDIVSVASIKCTNRFFRSYISDPKFDFYRFSGVESCLFYNCNSSDKYENYVCCKHFVSSDDSMPWLCERYQHGKRCYILGCCSGILLLYIDDLFVVNPFTKRFRLVDHSESKLFHEIVGLYHHDGPIVHEGRAIRVGFVVNTYRTTKRFKIVCIQEMQTMYGFEISDGDSWKLSKTTIISGSKAELMIQMKPIYLDNILHWLRNDGSIITFNLETEEAQLIPSKFDKKPDMKLLFSADDKTNRLTLISGTKEAILIYILNGNLSWDLSKRIKNVLMKENNLECWDVVLYDGKRLVVWEKKIHVYDMKDNSWKVLGPTKGSADLSYYKFTPSLYFIEDDEHKNEIVAMNDQRISYLTEIMEIVDCNTENLPLLTYFLGQ